MSENIYGWLQSWYQNNCSGDWEHIYGITIKTVDNPGWYVTINLAETRYENLSFEPINVELSDIDWYFCLIREQTFEASCSSLNLTMILQIFRDWVESAEIRG